MAITMRLAANGEANHFMEYIDNLAGQLSVLASPEEKLLEQKIVEQRRAKTWVELLGQRRG